MKSHIFAICDPHPLYAGRLAAYLTENRCTPFEVHAFTDTEALLAFAAGHSLELLLIAPEAVTEQTGQLACGRQILLVDTVPGPSRKGESVLSVYKYQAADSLIAEVLDLYRQTAPGPGLLPDLHEKVAIYGVYSPIHRCGKTSFALTLGEVLAETGQTLYLNTESFSGFENLFGKTWENDLLDLLYFFREQDGSLIYRLHSLVQTFHRLQFVPPASCAGELAGVTQEEWLSLLDTLPAVGGYDNLVLDLGESMGGLYSVLRRCSLVFMPVLEDRVSMAKLSQFEQQLSFQDSLTLQGKIRKIHPPVLPVPADASGKDLLRQFVLGENGSYVRKLLRLEKENSRN